MGAFEQKSVSQSTLPADVPSAQESASEHPDGAIFKASDGKRFRLRHARWVPVVKRERTAKTPAANAAKK